MATYYNEIEPYAAEWLRNLIKAGLIPDGEVDTRSIVDVRSSDLVGFDQCHFFAGIGGWAHALRLAGWPDDRPIWTGSCPCQPFSVAGKGLGTDDPRHLWPHIFRLIRAARPPVVMGEQVAGAAGYGWFDGVAADLEGEGYASRAVDVPACAVDAPHIRSRLYWVAAREARPGQSAGSGVRSDVEHAEGDRGHGALRRHQREKVREAVRAGVDRDVADASDERREELRLFRVERSSVPETARSGQGDTADADIFDAGNGGVQRGREQRGIGGYPRSCAGGTFWSDAVWLTGADGKARRAQPGLPLLAHGVSARVGRLRAYGNAIVPQIAAEVISAFMEVEACQS